jgi:hypothetical protein
MMVEAKQDVEIKGTERDDEKPGTRPWPHLSHLVTLTLFLSRN